MGPVLGEPKRGGTLLVVVVVLLAVGAAVTFGVVVLWPSGSDDGGSSGSSSVAADETTTTDDDDGDEGDDGDDGDDGDGTETTAEVEPQVSPEATTTTATTAPVPTDLLGGGFPIAYADLLAGAGQPPQLLAVSVYEGYAFLAYRDPADPAAIDRREWRAGEVGDATPNPAADRVDADAEARLFGPAELDPTLLAQLVADAPLHYDIPVTVSHVIIDRFLPFDERVLIRVYAVPTDGRSGGGYVSYDTAGALVNVCC